MTNHQLVNPENKLLNNMVVYNKTKKEIKNKKEKIKEVETQFPKIYVIIKEYERQLTKQHKQ